MEGEACEGLGRWKGEEGTINVNREMCNVFSKRKGTQQEKIKIFEY